MAEVRTRPWRRACAALALTTAGCAALLGGDDGVLDELDAGKDAGSDTSFAPDANGDGTDSSLDAGPDGQGDAAKDATACPGEAGPVGVRVGAFCIDGTEVTNRQYQLFLTAKGADVTGQPATCAWNTTHTPGAAWPSDAHDVPVVFVDWCDAYAYCAWGKKRLCGAMDGGSNDFDAQADASASQWFAACSHAGDGQHAYPYGNAYDPAACNGADSNDAGSLVDAGSQPACVGGYPGIFDLSGNAREWEDSCALGDGAAPQADSCRTRGGASTDDGGALTCARANARARSSVSGHTGFRCCTP